MTRFSPEVEAAIARAAARHGVTEERLRGFARIESGGDPRNVTGSYRGLYQLGPDEWKRYGGGADIFDPAANADAAARKLNDEAARFKAKYGRDPSTHELYMVHQQGEGGTAAHLANPDRPAWQNMLSTGEGRQKGEAWARAAIWGNVPADVRAKYGSVDNLTSAQFLDLWRDKVARMTGEAATPVAMASNLPAGGQTQAAAPNIAPATPAAPESNTGGFSGISNAVAKVQSDGLVGMLPDPLASAIKNNVASGDKPADPLGGDGFLEMPKLQIQAARLPKLNIAQARKAFRGRA